VSSQARLARVVPLVLVFTALLAGFASPVRAQGPRVLLAEISDAVDASTLEYVREAIDEAELSGYAALVVRFDTPGGALAETEAIASLLLGTNLPVLGWVGPVGAHAWSAGTILLESTDIAAMAPGSTIGSVQPVVIGPSGVEPVTDEKIIQAVVVSLQRKIALHVIPDRNESLAERFVIDNLNLGPSDARRLGATEFVADSVQDLLAQADGQRILLQELGPPAVTVKDLVVAVTDAEVVTFRPSLRVGFLSVLSDPLISSLLLILGIYLLIFGISAPGHGGEIAGIIILLLALVGLGFSVDPIAIFLFLVGIILILIEVKTPGFGVFGIGGIVAIVLAAAFLTPLRFPRFLVSPDYQVFFLAALLTPTGFLGGFLLFAVYKVQQIRRQKPTVGDMIGESATVVDGLRAGEKGYVMYRGELWQALADQDVPAETKVFIHAVDGITLHVSSSPPPVPEALRLRSRFVSFLRRKAA